jgi:predicted PurR-regulated permease PerM
VQGSSRRAARITLAVLLAIALALCVVVVWPFAASIIGAAVIAIVYYPLHLQLARRRIKPSWAAFLSTLLVLVAFLVPLALLITTLTQELRSAYQSLASGMGEQGAGRIWAALDGPFAAIETRLGIEPGQIRSMLAGRLQEIGSALLGNAMRVLGAAGGGVIRFVIGVGTIYCAFLYGSHLHKNVVAVSPLGRSRTETLLRTVQQMVMASFYGVIAVAAAQGLLCGLGVWIAGLPSPTLWGVAAAVVSVLPMFGSALVWLPAAAILFAQGAVGRGVFMLIWGAGLVGTVDNFIRPMVVMTKLPAHPLAVFVSMLGAVEAFGPIGILLGPVILAVTVALFRMLREEMGSGDSV